MGEMTVGGFSQLRVRILAGVPGKPNWTVDDGKVPYPSTAVDVAKLLAQRGIQAEFEHDRADRVYVSLKAAEIWIPILEVASGLSLGVAGNLMTDLIKDLLGPKATTTLLHVRFRVVQEDGEFREFEAEGLGVDVLKAIDQFGRQLPTQDGDD